MPEENIAEQAEQPRQTVQAGPNIGSLSDAFEMTLTNYINMRNRLYRKQKFSEIILIYYSFMLILNSLTLKYFVYNSDLPSYFGIALSILILTYSLINNASGYAIRVYKIDRAIVKLKKLRRDDSIDDLYRKKQYYEIIDNNEMREDIDFFETLCQRCRKFGCYFVRCKILFQKCRKYRNIENISQNICAHDKNLIRYIGEINPFLLFISSCMSIIKDIFLLLLPFLMFGLCVAPPKWLLESLKAVSH